MGMPNKLKNFDTFINGSSYLGKIAQVDLPELSRKTEAWRGGGQMGEVQIDMGQEAIEAELTLGGVEREILRQYGAVALDAIGLRFVGAYQNEGTGSYDTVEVVMRGRIATLGMGTAKAGDDTEKKVKYALVYYRAIYNGRDEIEIDMLNNVLVVDGVDLLAAQRAAMGR